MKMPHGTIYKIGSSSVDVFCLRSSEGQEAIGIFKTEDLKEILSYATWRS